MPNPTVYQLIVAACRREKDSDPITRWQARASWGCPENQVEGEPSVSEELAIASAIAAMKRSHQLEEGAFW